MSEASDALKMDEHSPNVKWFPFGYFGVPNNNIPWMFSVGSYLEPKLSFLEC